MTEIECSWIDEEFSGISFKDIRLVKRFKYILKKFMQQAQSNISSCFDSWSSIKGCYRFFSNDKIDKNVIIQEHQNSTISRIEESTGKIFIAHDTTYIDYKKHKKNGTLDRVFSSGKEKEGSLGV